MGLDPPSHSTRCKVTGIDYAESRETGNKDREKRVQIEELPREEPSKQRNQRVHQKQRISWRFNGNWMTIDARFQDFQAQQIYLITLQFISCTQDSLGVVLKPQKEEAQPKRKLSRKQQQKEKKNKKRFKRNNQRKKQLKTNAFNKATNYIVFVKKCKLICVLLE
eukprot:469422_1